MCLTLSAIRVYVFDEEQPPQCLLGKRLISASKVVVSSYPDL